MKKLFIIFFAFITGCATPHDVALERERVNDVTIAQLTSHAENVENHYWKYAQVEGVVWTPSRSDNALDEPDSYSNGGDSALFTGYMLASATFKYKVTRTDIDLFSVMRSVRGLYILTHATGTPGVIARCAFPASDPGPWSYPDGSSWQRRIPTGFVGTGPAHMTGGTDWEDMMRSFPSMVYYTRATRDQLTGVLFGLAVAWNELTDTSNPKIVAIRNVLREISNDVYNQLRTYNFNIRDENGKNETSADDVTGPMKLQLLALYRLTAPEHRRERIQEKYEDQFGWSIGLGSFEPWNIFNNYSQYFAWNLRYARAYTIWALEDNPERRHKLADYLRDDIWSYTSKQGCPFFIYINARINGPTRIDEALFALKSLTLRPTRQYPSPFCGDIRKPNILQVLIGDDIQYYLPPHLRKPVDYFTWTKRGWDVGSGCPVGPPNQDCTELDFMLPYWMGRRFGLVPSE